MSSSPTVSSTWADRPECGPCPAEGVLSEDGQGTTITIPPVTDTSLIDPDVLQNVLSAALAHGGDMAEVFAEDTTSASAMLDDRRVEELSSGRSRGAGIRVVAGETTGFAHTSDLSEKGLLAAAAAAASVARDGGGTVRTVAMQLGPLTAHDRGDRTLPSSVSKSAKLDLLVRADEAARAAGGSISQVQVGCGDSRRRILIANSDGLLAEDDQVRTRFSVMCVANGDTGMQTGYESLARTEGYEIFERYNVEDIARTAAGRALAKLSARPGPLGRGADRPGRRQRRHPLPRGLRPRPRGRPHRQGRLGVHRADGEAGGQPAGHPGRRRHRPRRVGELRRRRRGQRPGAQRPDRERGPHRLHVGLVAGPQGGRASSGNGRRQSYKHLPMVRMTNTYLLAGTENADEIVAQTPSGVYVTKLGGGQVNTTTGDFVFGTTEAYLIEDGHITEPLRDANLIGNGPEVLRRIDAVADDFDMTPGTCGKDGQSVPVGCGQATLRITGVTLGGTA